MNAVSAGETSTSWLAVTSSRSRAGAEAAEAAEAAEGSEGAVMHSMKQQRGG
jgi:hypothetical protein